jgi:rare lipoprotein A
MWWRRSGVVTGLLVALEACSVVKPTTPSVVDGHQQGVASWYGPGFHGRRTANGEVYDQYELTAAHQTLPLGTRALVTSLTNGRSVEVRINDRGPFVDGRIVDLSYAAASVIGMIGPGTMPVRLKVIDAPILVASPRTDAGIAATRAARPAPASKPAPVAARAAAVPAAAAMPAAAAVPAAAAPEPMPEGSFRILVATLSDAGRAEHLRSRIALKFPDVDVRPIDVGADRHYRVRIGPYPSRSVALARAELVNRYGYPAVITDENAQ